MKYKYNVEKEKKPSYNFVCISVSLPAILFGVLPQFGIKFSNATFTSYFKCPLWARGGDDYANTTCNYKQNQNIYVHITVHFQNAGFKSEFLDNRKHWRGAHSFFQNHYLPNIKTLNAQIYTSKEGREEKYWWKHYWPEGLRETVLSLYK